MGSMIIRALAGVSLLILPGAWLGFGLPIRRLSYAARFALAGVLSPVIVALQLILLRTLGLPFNGSVWAIVLVNTGSTWLLIRERGSLQVSWKPVVAFLGVYLSLAVFVIFPWASSRNTRIFTGHNWMHMGIVYEFPTGMVWPEEPELAGVRLAYPWLGHAYWAVLCWTLDLPPTRVFAPINLLWLFWICVLVYETCRSLGGSPRASRIGLLWLGFGTNVVGGLIWLAATLFGRDISRVPGDTRTLPWIEKFYKLNEMPFAMALLAALMLVAVHAVASRQRFWIGMVAILLAGVGLMHALLFPPALAICGFLLVLYWWMARVGSEPAAYRPAVMLLGGIAAATVVVLINAHMISLSRSAPLLHFSGLTEMLAKSVTGVLSMALFLAAMATMRRAQLAQPPVLLLTVGAVAGLVLRSLLTVGAGDNEYKFVLSAALFLAPVAALAVDRWVPRRVSPKLALISSLLLAITATPPLIQHSRRDLDRLPLIREEGFYVQPALEKDSGWIEALRTQTPSNTIVVVRDSNLFLPGITARSLWAPPLGAAPLPGYWLGDRWNLVQERGYPASLFDRRERTTRCVYECTDPGQVRQAEQQLTSLKRPVAIVFSTGEGREFLAMLERDPRARMLYPDRYGAFVWLLEP
jgi:hypothetical protein